MSAPYFEKELLDPNLKPKIKVSLAAVVLSSSAAGEMFVQISLGKYYISNYIYYSINKLLCTKTSNYTLPHPHSYKESKTIKII